MTPMIRDVRDTTAHGPGRIEIITGCMFSGKTNHLIERLTRAAADAEPFLAFKHQIDRRYANGDVVSHDGVRLPAQPIGHAADLLSRCDGVAVIGIDEGQFFDPDLPAVCETLRAGGRRIIVAGLNLDCRGKPFSPMDEMIAVADDVLVARATCGVCRAKADYTYRKTPLVPDAEMIGGSEVYEPRCGQCFRPPTAASAP